MEKIVKTPTPWEFDLYECERKGYGTVRLLVDGIKVSYQFARTDNNRLVFIFFVDGKYKGDYSRSDNDYGKRFGRAMASRISPKHESELKKWRYTKAEITAKKEAAKVPFGYSPLHRSAKSLIASLKKNNVSIELDMTEKEVDNAS